MGLRVGDSARVGAVLAAFFGAGAVMSAFLPLWLSDRGLSAGEIGFVLGAGSLLRVVGVPGGGWLADLVGRRWVLVGAAGVAAAGTAVLPGVHGVTGLFVVVAVVGVAASVLAPLTDAVTLALAGAGRLEYGRTRVWGSVSYMAATAGAGALLGMTGSGVVPVLLVVGYGLAAVFAVWVPDLGVGRRDVGGAPWWNASFRLALVGTVLIQGSHGAYYSFAPLLWREAGISDGVIGLLIAEGIVAEVAVCIWGRGVVAWLGPAGLTGVAAGACAVRWTATALTVDVGALAVVQVLHGVTFAFQHLSAMGVLTRVAPGRAGTAQAVLSAVGFSASTAAVVWVTGRLYGGLGGYVFLPVAAMGGAAVFTVGPLRRALAGGSLRAASDGERPHAP